MQTFHILDVKQFMQLLFQTDTLDSYLLVSANLTCDMNYSVDGHLNNEFFQPEELEQIDPQQEGWMPWSIAKDKIFSLIKGKKTPKQLKIVLKANSKSIQSIFNTTKSSLNSNDITGAFLNILFQDNQLNVTCGISYQIFTLDKSFEEEFSNNIITFLKSNSIATE